MKVQIHPARILRRAGLLILAIALGLCCVAYGEENPWKSEPYYVQGDDPENGDTGDLIAFKHKLYDLGFYGDQDISNDTLNAKALDDLTMQIAVRRVHDLNPELAYSKDYVTQEIALAVLGEHPEAIHLNVPAPLYTDLKPGEEYVKIVEEIQNRLNSMGYDQAGYHFTKGIYDDQLQGAINEFVRCNGLQELPEDGITVGIQERMFSEDAKPYVAGKNGDFSDRLFAWLGSATPIAGFPLPNWLMLVIGFALLCVIVLLLVKLFSSSQGAPKNKGSINFKITYKDKSIDYASNGKNYIRIGRGTGNFPLDTNDTKVSRKHCEIYYEDKTLILKDYSSLGTYINGVKCHNDMRILHTNDKIQVGEHTIVIQF